MSDAGSPLASGGIRAAPTAPEATPAHLSLQSERASWRLASDRSLSPSLAAVQPHVTAPQCARPTSPAATLVPDTCASKMATCVNMRSMAQRAKEHFQMTPTSTHGLQKCSACSKSFPTAKAALLHRRQANGPAAHASQVNAQSPSGRATRASRLPEVSSERFGSQVGADQASPPPDATSCASGAGPRARSSSPPQPFTPLRLRQLGARRGEERGKLPPALGRFRACPPSPAAAPAEGVAQRKMEPDTSAFEHGATWSPTVSTGASVDAVTLADGDTTPECRHPPHGIFDRSLLRTQSERFIHSSTERGASHELGNGLLQRVRSEPRITHRCPACGEAFASFDEARMHFLAEHSSSRAMPDATPTTKAGLNAIRVLHKCPTCSETFPTAEEALEHWRSLHRPDVLSAHEAGRSHKCIICSDVFPSAEEAVKHWQASHLPGPAFDNPIPTAALSPTPANGRDVLHKSPDCTDFFATRDVVLTHSHDAHAPSNASACPQAAGLPDETDPPAGDVAWIDQDGNDCSIDMCSEQLVWTCCLIRRPLEELRIFRMPDDSDGRFCLESPFGLSAVHHPSPGEEQLRLMRSLVSLVPAGRVRMSMEVAMELAEAPCESVPPRRRSSSMAPLQPDEAEEVIAYNNRGEPMIARRVDTKNGTAKTTVITEDGSQHIFGEASISSLLANAEGDVNQWLGSLSVVEMRGLVYEIGQRLHGSYERYQCKRKSLCEISENTHLSYFGLRRGSTEQDLDKAYRQRARDMHPDKNGGTEEAKERFQHMRLRYEALKEQLKQAEPDRWLLPRQERANEEHEGMDNACGVPVASTGQTEEEKENKENKEAEEMAKKKESRKSGDDVEESGISDISRNPSNAEGETIGKCEDPIGPNDREALERQAREMIKQLKAINHNEKIIEAEFKRHGPEASASTHVQFRR